MQCFVLVLYVAHSKNGKQTLYFLDFRLWILNRQERCNCKAGRQPERPHPPSHRQTSSFFDFRRWILGRQEPCACRAGRQPESFLHNCFTVYVHRSLLSSKKIPVMSHLSYSSRITTLHVSSRRTSAASGLYGCFVFCPFLLHWPQPFCLAKSFCCKVSIGLHVADHSAPMFCPAASCASGSIGTIFRYIEEQGITLGI